MESEEIYLVWNPKGDLPKATHDSKESAFAEAERLAEKHMAGNNFFVLKAIGKCFKQPAPITRKEFGPQID